MKRANFMALALILLTPLVTLAYDDGDFQVWNTDDQEIKLNDKLKLFTQEEFRFGDDAGNLYYQHYEIGLSYPVNNSLDISLAYRHVLEKKNGEFKTENEPNINAILKWQMCDFKLSNRFRLEYRHFDYTTDMWRFRNMLTLRFPWKFTKLEIQPYLADEVFFVSKGTGLNTNRAYAGLSFSLFKNFKADLYYMMQSTKSKYKWTAVNVLGTKLKLIF